MKEHIRDLDGEPDYKLYEHCANCGAPLGRKYFTYRDNFIQVNYFDEFDGADNAFCSEVCAGEALMLDEVENIRGMENEGRVESGQNVRP
jgi:hypothetical protein